MKFWNNLSTFLFWFVLIAAISSQLVCKTFDIIQSEIYNFVKGVEAQALLYQYANNKIELEKIYEFNWVTWSVHKAVGNLGYLQLWFNQYYSSISAVSSSSSNGLPSESNATLFSPKSLEEEF